MKRNKLFLLPLFMLLLAGCRDVSSSSKPEPSDSIPPIVSSEPSEQESEEPSSEVEEPSSEVEEPSSEPAESSSEEESLPPIVDPEEPTVEETTIAAIRAMTEGWDSVATKDKEQKYEVSGTVTHKFRGAVEKSTGKSLPAWNIAIQDDNGQALLLYALTEDDYAADFADVPIGSLLTVTGHLATYGGLRELDRVEYVSHEEGVAIEPVVLDSIEQSTLVGKDSLLVKIPDLKLKKVTKLEANVDGTFVNITVDITLEKGGHEIGTYMHYNIPIADAEETVALLETVKSTDTITWTGILGINNKTFQLTNASVDEWDITKGEAAVLEGISFSEEEVEVLMEETVELELVADPFDAVIEGATYESADPLVATVDANGVVTGVSAGETVVTATVGELTATIDVVVIDPATLEPSTTVTAEALGLAAYGPVEDVEIDGILWSGTEMGDYGAGIQIRNKDGNDFSLYNTTAFPGKVKTVTLTNFTGKFPHKVDMFGATELADVLDADPVLLYEDEDTQVVSYTFDEADAIYFLHFMKTEDNYSGYIESIHITFYVVEDISVTAEGLGLAAYGPVEDVDIGGVLWSGTEMGDYGAGIQIRNKDGNDFSLYNTTAFPGKVKTVTLTNFTGKFPHKVDMFGATELADVLDADPVLLYEDEDTQVVSYTFDEADAIYFLHFMKTEDNYSGYIESIVISFY